MGGDVVTNVVCASSEGGKTENLDCQGYFAECTTKCETAAERIWTQTQAPSGTGKSCPVYQDCKNGDGICGRKDPPEWCANDEHLQLATQLFCHTNCGVLYDGVQGCQQTDADLFCKITTCNEDAVA